jgi:hypothetical protein
LPIVRRRPICAFPSAARVGGGGGGAYGGRRQRRRRAPASSCVLALDGGTGDGTGAARRGVVWRGVAWHAGPDQTEQRSRLPPPSPSEDVEAVSRYRGAPERAVEESRWATRREALRQQTTRSPTMPCTSPFAFGTATGLLLRFEFDNATTDY